MSSQSSQRADIEGLRAIAVALVLLYHAGVAPFDGGFLGVDVFFVISGFLITRSLVEEAERTGGVRLSEFYARRARRLLPASALVIVATGAAIRLVLPATSWREFGGDLIGAAAYVLNWRLARRSVDYLAEDVAASPLQHFWSLSIEEQFYFVWPVLILVALAVATRRGWRVRAVTGWVLLVFVAAPSLVWSLISTYSDPAYAFFDTRTRMWEVALGGLVAIVLPHLPPIPDSVAVVAKALAVAAIVGLAVVLDEAVAWPGFLALGATLPTAVLLALGERRGFIDRALALPGVQRVGAWSYSLYLWHWPPLAIIAATGARLTVPQSVAVTLLACVPAVLSYYLLENPIRFHTSLRASSNLSLSLGLNLTFVGVLGGFMMIAAIPSGAASPSTGLDPLPARAGAQALTAGTTDAELLAALDSTRHFVPAPSDARSDLPVTYDQGCQVPDRSSEPVVCEFGDPEGDLTVALVGDSKAAQWLTPLDAIASTEGWTLLHVVKSACPLSTAEVSIQDNGVRERCRDWGRKSIELLRTRRPDLVLVSQVAGRAIGEDEDLAESQMVDGMVAAYEQLEEAGIRVAVLMDTPKPPFTVYECLAEYPNDLRACTFGRDQAGGGSRVAQQRAVKAGGFEVVETLDLVCPTATCMPVIGGVAVYRQGSHITDTYAASAEQHLRERITPLLDRDG